MVRGKRIPGMLFKTQEKLKKTQKTPLIMSAVFDLACCSCTLVPESMLSGTMVTGHYDRASLSAVMSGVFEVFV